MVRTVGRLGRRGEGGGRRGGLGRMESAIKDNWIQVRRLRCTRATVKALFIKQRETESGPSPREHVAHGQATRNMVIRHDGTGAGGGEGRGGGGGQWRCAALPHFANIHAPYECH